MPGSEFWSRVGESGFHGTFYARTVRWRERLRLGADGRMPLRGNYCYREVVCNGSEPILNVPAVISSRVRRARIHGPEVTCVASGTPTRVRPDMTLTAARRRARCNVCARVGLRELYF